MSQSCLWLPDELKRQAEAEPLYGLTQMTIPTIVLPNGDEYTFDICLTHGEIRGYGKTEKKSE
jgi:hypothetical protein